MSAARIRNPVGDPLSAEQRRAAKRAGGLALLLVSAGAAILWAMLAASLVAIVLRFAVLDLVRGAAFEADVERWVSQLDVGWLVPIVLALVAVAVASMAMGCWASMRRLRDGGVVDAAGVTFRGAALGTALQAVLSALSSWLLGLLTLLTGVLGFWIIASIWLVLSLSASALIGWLAGPRLWLALARRAAMRAAVHAAGPDAVPRQAVGPGA